MKKRRTTCRVVMEHQPVRHMFEAASSDQAVCTLSVRKIRPCLFSSNSITRHGEQAPAVKGVNLIQGMQDAWYASAAALSIKWPGLYSDHTDRPIPPQPSGSNERNEADACFF